MCEKMIETLLQHGLIVNPGDVDNPCLLNTAVEKRYLKIVEDLLKYGAAVNMLTTTSRFGVRCTPLHSAVCGKQVEMAKLLINYGANVNVEDSHGKTPLFCAIRTRNTEMTELLLTNGAYIQHDPMVLCTAVEYGCLKIVEELLKDGVDVNKFSTSGFREGSTLLHIAVNREQLEMVELLINYGANVTIKDANGRTPLVCAIPTLNTKMIELLVINGADIKEDPTLLFIAIQSRDYIQELQQLRVLAGVQIISRSLNQGVWSSRDLNDFEDPIKNGPDVNRSPDSSHFADIRYARHRKQVEVAELLINYGANVNITDAKGITPLVYATKTRNTKLIELLLINGADIKGDPEVLYTAVGYGCLKIVEELLKDGVDVNKLTTSGFRRGSTLLHIAVDSKQLEMVELLINYGANVTIKDAEGITPLVCATKTRNTKLIELLLINGADIKGDPKVLYTAVEYGCLKIVEDLLKDGADVNMLTTSEFGRGITLLHTAVRRKHVEMAKLLINYGANVNIKNAVGNAPLIYAIATMNTKMIELLLINGADIKGDPKILFTAVEYECLKIVEDLLKDGADVNMLTTSEFGRGITLLHKAVCGKRVEMAKLLINYGAYVKIEDAKGITLLECAIKTGYAEMIELLLINGAVEVPKVLCIAAEFGCSKLVGDRLKDGANVNMLTTSRFGVCCTPLHSAVRGEQVKIAKLLINYGANVTIKDAEGITPLVCAIKTGNTEMIELLLINGADVKRDPAVLCIAAEFGCFKLVEDLLKDGANVNMLTTSRFGECCTPLHSAVRRNQVKIAKLLINYGANINVERYRGIVPLHDAIQNRDTKMIKLLLINGADIKVNLELQYTNSENINLVKRHIAKAKAAGLHLIVSEINLLWLKDREIKNFLNLCEAEIEIMKSEMMGNSCSSFYDILIKDISQLARNESIVWALNYADYKTKFPIYASMIDSRRRRLVERGVLLKQVRNKVLHSFFKSLPVLCTEKIFSYLNDRDLRILLAA